MASAPGPSRRALLRLGAGATAATGLAAKTIHQNAETCGYAGLETYTVSWQHVDSRVEYPYGSQSWW